MESAVRCSSFLIGPLIDYDMWIMGFFNPFHNLVLSRKMCESYQSLKTSQVSSLSFLLFLLCLAAFLQTWHKQKKRDY